MSLGATPLADPHDDPHAQLRHDLKTPLTTILARAQLLARSIRRSSSLTELERAALLESLTTIEAAARAMIPLIEGIGSPVVARRATRKVPEPGAPDGPA